MWWIRRKKHQKPDLDLSQRTVIGELTLPELSPTSPTEVTRRVKWSVIDFRDLPVEVGLDPEDASYFLEVLAFEEQDVERRYPKVLTVSKTLFDEHIDLYL